MIYAFVFLAIVFSLYQKTTCKEATEAKCGGTTKGTTEIPNDDDNLILRRRESIPLHEFHAISLPHVSYRRMNREDDVNYRKTRDIENNVELTGLPLIEIPQRIVQESMMQKQKQFLRNEKEKRLQLQIERKKRLDNFRRELRWLHTMYNDAEGADDNNEIK